MRRRGPALRILSASLAILCWTAAVFAQEPAPPAPEGSRYEGYEFLDAAGKPLPTQSDRAIEAYLASSKVVSICNIPEGVTDPRKLLLAKDGLRVNAVFKDIDKTRRQTRLEVAGKARFFLEFRDWYGYDIAAYRLDRLLGLDRVPPVTERTVRGHRGSVQIWVEGVITRTAMRAGGIEPPDIARWNQQKNILYIFDSLVANTDSNTGNALIDGRWRLWFIDCSRCFNTTHELYYLDGITHCERHLWHALQNLDPNEVHRQLAPYLNRAQIEAVLARRDLIVKHLRGLIEEWGEGVVLFDVQPCSIRAPWAIDR